MGLVLGTSLSSAQTTPQTPQKPASKTKNKAKALAKPAKKATPKATPNTKKMPSQKSTQKSSGKPSAKQGQVKQSAEATTSRAWPKKNPPSDVAPPVEEPASPQVTATPIPVSVSPPSRIQGGTPAEMAIRKVTLLAFQESTAVDEISLGLSNADAVSLCQSLSEQINFKSYLQSTCYLAKGSGAWGQDFAKKVGLLSKADGILLGQFFGASLEIKLHNAQTGRVLASWLIPVDSLNKNGQVALRERILDSFLRSFPYRGFVTQVRPDQSVELNLGFHHGLAPGMTLTLFEYTGEDPVITGERQTLGTVQVTEVKGADSSMAKPVGDKMGVRPYAKVGIDPIKSGAALAEESRDGEIWLALGSELFSVNRNIDTTGNSQRGYQMFFMPYVHLGYGFDKWFGHVNYGSQNIEDNTITLIEGRLLRQVWASEIWGLGGAVAVGVWGERYNVAARQSAVRALQSGGAYAPDFDFQLTYSPRPRVRLTTGFDIRYPIMTEGQTGSVLPFSMGLAVWVGGRVDLNHDWSVESGVRYRMNNIALEGFKGVKETQPGVFGRIRKSF